MERLLPALVFALITVSCADPESNSGTDTVAPRVHPPEALKLADSAFHSYFMHDDSCSLLAALDLYRQSLEIDPDNFITLSNKLQLETRLARYTDGLNTARAMLRLSGYRDPITISRVGMMLELCGDTVQARRFYRWGLEVAEHTLDTMSSSNEHRMDAFITKAMMYQALNDQPATDEALDEAIGCAKDSSLVSAITEMKGKTKAYYKEGMLQAQQKVTGCDTVSVDTGSTVQPVRTTPLSQGSR